MDCGLPVPLLTTVIVALRVPVAAGMKVTLNEQPLPAATLAQVDPLTANSPLLLLVIDDTDTAAPPVLLSETACDALAEPIAVAGIVTLEGIDSCPGAGPPPVTPVPVNEIGKVLPPPVN